MDNDAVSHWLPIDEAARRLDISVDAVRSRIRRGQLEKRRGNDRRMLVLVLASSAPSRDEVPTGSRQGADEASEAPTGLPSPELVSALSAARQELVDAWAEAEHWRGLAEERGLGLAKAETALGELRGVLEREQARGDRLEVELHRPWWRRLIG